ncbi:MAG: YdcF family protein [Rhodoglobus sp.]
MSFGRRLFVMGRVALWAVVGIVMTLVIASLPLFVFPAHDSPIASDALVVLGPSRDRMPLARELMEKGYSTTLVIVSPVLENGRFEVDLCNNDSEVDYTVECFSAIPTTTRGEARGVRALSEREGWDSIMVLTFTPHLSRARVIFERCFTGDIRMIEYRPDFEVTDWARESLYQYGGFAKVLTETGC